MSIVEPQTLGKVLHDAEVFTDGDWVESKDQDPNGDVRLIQLADVGDGKYVNKSSRFLTAQKATELRCTYLSPGDVLIARMPDPLGRACIFPGDTKPSVSVVDVCIVRPNQKAVDSRYLMHCINTKDFRHQVLRKATGTTRQRISRGNLSKLKIPLPPIEEQKRIAAILDAADELRTKRRESIAQLDSLLQSTFLDMFGDPVTNPKGWEVRQLDDLIINGPQNGLYKPASSYGKGTRILRIDGFYDGELRSQEKLKRVELSDSEISKYCLCGGDIVINRVNSREYLGKSALIPVLKEPTVFESNMMRFSICAETVRPHYLINFLQSKYIKNQILNSAKDAVNQSSINQDDVKKLNLLVPCIEQQDRFSKFRLATIEIERKLKSQLTELDTLFASLQSRAFRGEL